MTIAGNDKLQTQSLGEQVAEIIAREIVGREIKPRTRLAEEDIARRFGVSRTPARDAMRILAQEHLVKLLPRRGAEVIELGAQRVVDLYEIRSRLHGLAVALVVTGEQPLDRFGELSQAMAESAAANDIDRFVHANMAFHQLAERLADNGFLTANLASLGRLTVHLRERGLRTPGRLERSAAEHADVYEAMRAGDALAAESLTRDLIIEAGEAILRADFPDACESAVARLRRVRSGALPAPQAP